MYKEENEEHFCGDHLGNVICSFRCKQKITESRSLQKKSFRHRKYWNSKSKQLLQNFWIRNTAQDFNNLWRDKVFFFKLLNSLFVKSWGSFLNKNNKLFLVPWKFTKLDFTEKLFKVKICALSSPTIKKMSFLKIFLFWRVHSLTLNGFFTSFTFEIIFLVVVVTRGKNLIKKNTRFILAKNFDQTLAQRTTDQLTGKPAKTIFFSPKRRFRSRARADKVLKRVRAFEGGFKSMSAPPSLHSG